jgi:hypothetical protein
MKNIFFIIALVTTVHAEQNPPVSHELLWGSTLFSGLGFGMSKLGESVNREIVENHGHRNLRFTHRYDPALEGFHPADEVMHRLAKDIQDGDRFRIVYEYKTITGGTSTKTLDFIYEENGQRSPEAKKYFSDLDKGKITRIQEFDWFRQQEPIHAHQRARYFTRGKYANLGVAAVAMILNGTAYAIEQSALN